MLSVSHKRLLYGVITSTLGFYRGAHHYEYNYINKLNKYEKEKENFSP